MIKVLTKGPRRKLARILRNAVDTSGIEPWEAARRIVYWWPTLDLSVEETTPDIARALAGVPAGTFAGGRLRHRLFNAVCRVHKLRPILPPLTQTLPFASNGPSGASHSIKARGSGMAVQAHPEDKLAGVKGGMWPLAPGESMTITNDGRGGWHITSHTAAGGSEGC